jgi:hypothetical protein
MHQKGGQYLDGCYKEGERKSLQIGPPPDQNRADASSFACHFSLFTSTKNHPERERGAPTAFRFFGISFFEQQLKKLMKM